MSSTPPAPGGHHDRVTPSTRLGLLALACVVIAIMAFDIRARTGAAPTTSSPADARTPAPLAPIPEVKRGLDKTPLVYPAQFVDQLVQGRRAAFLLAVPADGGEATAGVLIGPREAIIASALDVSSWVVTPAWQPSVRAERRAVDPVHGLTLLTLAADVPATLVFGPASLASGSPVVAVRPTETALVTQLIPAPGTEASLAVRLAASQLPAGTAVIDLDGRLVAFFGAGVEGGVPIVGNELDATILPALRKGHAPERPWLGADLQALDARLAAHVGPGVAVVTWVEPGSPADRGGLRTRDVITDWRTDGTPMASVDALQAALRPGVSIAMDVRRGAAVRSSTITVGERRYPPGVSVLTGAAIDDARVPTVRVAPASPLARAGLRSGDAVEAVDGHAVDAAGLERTLGRGREVMLTIRRNGHRRFVVLPALPGAKGGR